MICPWVIQQHTCKPINKQTTEHCYYHKENPWTVRCRWKWGSHFCTRWSGKISLWHLSRGENGSQQICQELRERLWAEGLKGLLCLYEEGKKGSPTNARARAWTCGHLPGIIRLTITCSQGKEKSWAWRVGKDEMWTSPRRSAKVCGIWDI